MNNKRAWRAGLAGGVLASLCVGAAWAAGPGVLFVSNRDGHMQIYRAADDGGAETRLTFSQGGNNQPAWSPDGRRIAFTSTRDGNPEIYVSNADGSDARRLTNDPAIDVRPAWSPDGGRIAFVSTREGRSNIHVMNADGSAQRAVTAASGELSGGAPIWSPDGKTLYFLMGVGNKNQLHAIQVDGSGLKDLTSAISRGGKGEADLSPDGRWLVFTTAEDKQPVNLMVMRADGSEARQITRDQGDNYSPHWSPDGRHIAFVSSRDDLVRSEIYVVNADGTAPRNVSNHPRDDFEPRWVDGRTVVFASMRAPITQLFRVDIEAAQPQRITHSQSLELEPTPFAGSSLQSGLADGRDWRASLVLNRSSR